MYFIFLNIFQITLVFVSRTGIYDLELSYRIYCPIMLNYEYVVFSIQDFWFKKALE